MIIRIDMTEPEPDKQSWDAVIKTDDARILTLLEKLIDNGDIYDFTIQEG